MQPTRRHFLQASLGALLASALAERDARARPSADPAPRAKSCVLLWMNGGPSHIDTWDPKPGAPTGGPFKAIKTRAPAIQLSQHLPEVAAQAHHLAIVRSMSSKEGNHQRARQLLHTGYTPNPTADHPSIGAWVARDRDDPTFDLPRFVSIGGPSADAGFLGVEYGPFVVQRASVPPENVAYARVVTKDRFDRRAAALAALEGDFSASTRDPRIKERDAVYSKAVRLMRSPRLGAFDLASEPAAAALEYGDSEFGRGCLLARRLVESGVSFVEIMLDGWDTHQDNFGRVERLLGVLDPAMATLVGDLEKRRLLDSTLVVCLGDFGRTPTINPNEGRDHYPQAWSAVLAGGGIRGGLVVGETDALGAKVAEPTSVADLFATIATTLGLDPAMTLRTRAGRPISITDAGRPIAKLLG